MIFLFGKPVVEPALKRSRRGKPWRITVRPIPDSLRLVAGHSLARLQLAFSVGAFLA
jgi:hypothetical protein